MGISDEIDAGNAEAVKAVRRFIIRQGQYFREDVMLMQIKAVVQQNYPPVVHKQVIIVGDDWDWRGYNNKHLEHLRDTPMKAVRNKVMGVLRSITHIRG
jgi:hypothetical protein